MGNESKTNWLPLQATCPQIFIRKRQLLPHASGTASSKHHLSLAFARRSLGLPFGYSSTTSGTRPFLVEDLSCPFAAILNDRQAQSFSQGPSDEAHPQAHL